MSRFLSFKNLHVDDKTYDYKIAFAGNPNVGKSTIFNSLTGMCQHTGNWPGKTVSSAFGMCKYKDCNFMLVDIPGTYSLMSNSEEEEIARNYICFENPDVTVIVVDATCLERNLNLVYQIMEITSNIVVCVNLLDEAKRKGINVNLRLLSKLLGVPVVGTIANKKKTINNLMKTIYDVCTLHIQAKPSLVQYSSGIESLVNSTLPLIEENISSKYSYLSRWICLKLIDGDSKVLSSIKDKLDLDLSSKKFSKQILENSTSLKDSMISSIIHTSENIASKVCTYNSKSHTLRDKKIDKILTSKTFGIPIMLLFLGIILWLTLVGANYPSALLSTLFSIIQNKLLLFFNKINAPQWLTGLLINGVFQTVSWVVSVMLPPMAIFFPLFTVLEDLGYLPRIAFNLDKCFQKCGATGKQALTMCMGLGCNATGVIGCRIINSKREKLLAILTNSFVPCNGRFPFLIAVASIFITSLFSTIYSSLISSLCVLLIIIIGIFFTLIISKFLSNTILKGIPSSFILELPPYRKPQVSKILIRSLLDRTLFVLGRAISVAAPVGLIIWAFANINISGMPLLCYIANFLDPFAKILGLDGYILCAFILGIPANEIVLPIILMCYMSQNSLIKLEDFSAIGQILKDNGWTILTAINVMLFTLLHFPCATTLLTIKKETGSYKWSLLAFLLPTVCGMLLCMFTNLIYVCFF